MKNLYFKRKSRMVFILFSIAIASLAVRLLMNYRFHESALLYVGLPFVIAIALILLRSPAENIGWKRRYLNHLIDALIILLGSSVLLFEGFVCVAMFIPIYLAIMLFIFVFDLIRRWAKGKKRNHLSMHILPVLIALSSLEGVIPSLSFEREEQVVVTRVVTAGIAEIKHNLQLPMDLRKPRPWFLYLFPMPYEIQAASLTPGDVHKIHYRYYRWFVTNVHEGHMSLEIAEVEEDRVKTRILEDSSYIANYLHIKGTEIRLQKIDDTHTRVTLQIDFTRTLDPYWYFAPLERYGVGKAAEFLISEVIAREHS